MSDYGAMDYSAFKEAWEEHVAELIHERWLKRGSPEGSPETDWFTVAQDFDQAFSRAVGPWTSSIVGLQQ